MSHPMNTNKRITYAFAFVIGFCWVAFFAVVGMAP